MTTHSRNVRWIAWGLQSAAVAGGIGLLGYLRSRFQNRRLFVPDRYPNGIWNPAPFGLPAQDVWFAAADGHMLHGWWVPHRKARGTILYCHGNTGSIAHQIEVFRRLRRLGVNVLGFDYRGYGRSEGTPSEKGLYSDVRGAFDHLVEELGIESGEIILFGHSLGGAVAVDCALDREPAGLVIQSTFTHLKAATRAAFPGMPVHLLALRRFHTAEKVARIGIPKLFIHGTADGTLPHGLGLELYDRAREPKELYLVRHAGHNDVYRHGGRRYLRRLARFRTRCLATSGRG